MIKAVIFDMDGVLLDTEKHFTKAWIEAARDCGIDYFTPELSLRLRSVSSVFAEPLTKELYGEDFPFQEIRMKRREKMKERLKKYGLEKKEGVEKALKELKEKGYKIAVATASDYERASASLKEVGLFDYFGEDSILCATEVEYGKPYPDVYLAACKALGERPEDCVAVEDSPCGVTSAYRAGMKVFMIPDLTQPDEKTMEMLTGKADSMQKLAEML